VFSILAIDYLRASESPLAEALRWKLRNLNVEAAAPLTVVDCPTPSAVKPPLAPFWNPFAAVQGESAPSLSQQSYQTKLQKIRPLYRLLYGNQARLSEILGSAVDISDSSDCRHFVSQQILSREMKDMPAFMSGNFENAMRLRFADTPREESKNKFSAVFLALFHAPNSDGSIFVFTGVQEIWKVIVDFYTVLDRLVGEGQFYQEVFTPLALALTDVLIGSLKNAEIKFVVYLVNSKLVAFGDLLANDLVKDLDLNNFRKLCFAALKVDVPSEMLGYVVTKEQIPNQFTNALVVSPSPAGKKNAKRAGGSPNFPRNNKSNKSSSSASPQKNHHTGANSSGAPPPPSTTAGNVPLHYCIAYFAKELGVVGSKGCIKPPGQTCFRVHIKKPPVGVPLDAGAKSDLVSAVSNYYRNNPSFKDSFLTEIHKL
jgi:hypothetical protein